MKTITIVLVLSVLALTSAQLPGGCVTLQGLDFCQAFNGFEVDAFVTFDGDGPAYAQTIDAALAEVFDAITQAFDALGDQHGFDVCGACLDRFKAFLCAGAFPSCGFFDCLLRVFGAAVEEQCEPLCLCVDCEEFNSGIANFADVLQNCERNPLGAFACLELPPEEIPACVQAVNDAVEACGDLDFSDAVAESILGECGTLFPSSAQCRDFLATCSCLEETNADIGALCDAVYSPTGFLIPGYPTTGDCESVNGWCDPQGVIEGFVGINPNCFLAPPPSVAEATVRSGDASSPGPPIDATLDVDSYVSGLVVDTVDTSDSAAASMPRVGIMLVAALLAYWL